MRNTFLENPKLILFGILTAFISGPGQTFLVSLFTPHLIDEFSLSSGQFGTLYSAGTLMGAIALPYLGRLLDRMDLLQFTVVMAVCLTLGCLGMSLAYSPVVMFLGLSLIRCFGQGAMSLVSSTTTARSFGKNRGKALGLTGLGHPLSSAFFPLITAYWISEHGWRSGWTLLAGLVLLMYVPTIYLLLKGQGPAVRRADAEGEKRKKIKYGKLFKDWVFVAAVFAGVMNPFILTGVFLYQVQIGAWKGWGVELIATGFVALSFVRAIAVFGIGGLVDRFKAQRIYSVLLFPLLLSLLSLRFGSHPIFAIFYLGFAGLAVGLGMTVKPAFWAETFGTDNLGALRGLTGFFAVLATAMGPPLFGWALDRGVPVSSVLDGLMVLVSLNILVSFAVSYAALRRGRKRR